MTLLEAASTVKCLDFQHDLLGQVQWMNQGHWLEQIHC